MALISVNERYLLVRKLHESPNGTLLYEGVDQILLHKVAVKIQHKHMGSRLTKLSILHKHFEDIEGIPEVFWTGIEGEYYVLVT
jgi:hypothetical protein